MKKAITLSVFLIGFTAMAAQILFIREFLVAFYGNELSISLVLGNWMAGGALGSWLAGRLAEKIRSGILWLVTSQVILSLLIPADIYFIRVARSLIGISPGEIMPIFPMFCLSLIILLPVSCLLGSMFSISCLSAGYFKGKDASKVGTIYTLEAGGSVAGGALISFILLAVMGSMQIAMVLSIINAIAAFYIINVIKRHEGLKSSGTGSRFIVFIASIVLLVSAWTAMDFNSLKEMWKGYQLISSRNSVYGNIALVKRGEEYSFFDNGLHLFTVPDRMAAEEGAHYAMLEHPDPKKVLLIGGGVSGLADEILKYQVDKLDYLELDPLLIETAIDNLPAKFTGSLKNSKVSIINDDGRYFIKNTKNTYDCIIMQVGEPCTAQINRYYTREYFVEVKKIMAKGGVFSFSVRSSENYINRELKEVLRSIYATMSPVFKDIKVVPGERAVFLASDDKILTYDYNVLARRAKEKTIDLQYLREYYLFSSMSPERIKYLEEIMRSPGNVRVNHDLRPSTYYYELIAAAGYFRDSVSGHALNYALKEWIWGALLFGFIMLVLIYTMVIRKEVAFETASMAAIMTTGFTSITFQMVILLSFQSLYGYLFYMAGFILTAFMVGIVTGAWLMSKILDRIRSGKAAMIMTQALFTLYPVTIVPVLFALGSQKVLPYAWVGVNIVYAVMPFISGIGAGMQFPLVNMIYAQKSKSPGRSVGAAYALDLAGSWAGAILAGVFLIPVIGMAKICIMLSVLNAAILAILSIAAVYNRSLSREA